MRVEFLNEVGMVHTLRGKSYNAMRKVLPKADIVRSDVKVIWKEFKERSVSPVKYVIGEDWIVFGCIEKMINSESVAPFLQVFGIVHQRGARELNLVFEYLPYCKPERQLPFSKESIILLEKKLNIVMRKFSFTDNYYDMRKVYLDLDGMDWRK